MEDEKRRIDRMDRISSLPQPLLQHIMSYLPFKQVVQTSVLSTVWRQAWLTFPVLEFDEFRMGVKIRPYWEQILQIRRRNMVGVRKITLKTFSRTGDSEWADRCASYAIENNVQDLALEVNQIQSVWHNQRFQSVRYSLPPIVLCSKSIDVLKLGGCKLELPRSDLKLSLRKLCLQNVYADDQVINNVFLGCGLIEDLEVNLCQGFKSLKLLGLAKLRNIRLEDNDELEQLEIDALNANSVLSVSGTTPYILDICKNLTSLYLSNSSFITDEWLCSNISRLPLLEKLFICQCSNVEHMKISSCHLKYLDIYDCRKLVEVAIETPNLSIFRYTGDVISFSSGAAMTLSEAHLCFFTNKIRNFIRPSKNIQWYVKYIKLLSMFRQSQVVNLQSDCLEHWHFPRELRQILTPPFSGVKHFKFGAGLLLSFNYPLARVVDSLLWISPHAETICLQHLPHGKFCFQFSYKQPPVYERCCKSLHFLSCWEHCIEKVDIEITSVWRSSYVKRCVVEGKNIWEKIDSLAVSGP
ncbi:F-box domain containing protein [Melia azedarach]|uniref:F-box domain containing protein n=1 Tax=Melia azedarach TaxID=155640 RepID=A0ACC1Y4N6_MELAZ|nr:F-box domain containing protein [Melia azedarach]